MRRAGEIAAELFRGGASAHEVEAGLVGLGLSKAVREKILARNGWYWVQTGEKAGGHWTHGMKNAKAEMKEQARLNAQAAANVTAHTKPWTIAGTAAGRAYIAAVGAAFKNNSPWLLTQLTIPGGPSGGGGGPGSGVQNLNLNGGGGRNPGGTTPLMVSPQTMDASITSASMSSHTTAEVNHNFRGLPPGISASEVAEQVRRGSDASGLARALRYERSFRTAP